MLTTDYDYTFLRNERYFFVGLIHCGDEVQSAGKGNKVLCNFPAFASIFISTDVKLASSSCYVGSFLKDTMFHSCTKHCIKDSFVCLNFRIWKVDGGSKFYPEFVFVCI